MREMNLKYTVPHPVKKTKVFLMTAGWGIFIFGGRITMGHVLFLILHFFAFMFGFVFLFITIPCHILYAAMTNKGQKA